VDEAVMFFPRTRRVRCKEDGGLVLGDPKSQSLSVSMLI
jgi:hypothetical protein